MLSMLCHNRNWSKGHVSSQVALGTSVLASYSALCDEICPSSRVWSGRVIRGEVTFHRIDKRIRFLSFPSKTLTMRIHIPDTGSFFLVLVSDVYFYVKDSYGDIHKYMSGHSHGLE